MELSLIYAFVCIITELSSVKSQKCVKMNHESEEFRLSADDYPVLEMLQPSACQEYCKGGNFSYAAVMAQKYCLCSYTNYDYPEVDESCCKLPSVYCGEDPDIFAAMEVNETPDITVQLNVERKKIGFGEASKVVVEYTIDINTNVQAEVLLFYDQEEIRTPLMVIGPEIQDKFLFTNAALPGRHLAKALVTDTAKGITSVFDEQEIFIPDERVNFDMVCPEEVMTDDTGVCNVTINRGTDLTMRIKYGSDEEEEFVIPDATVIPIGQSIPHLPMPSVPVISMPPEVVRISIGQLPFSNLVGFDFMISSTGTFEVQILAPKCSDRESFCQTCQSSCPEKGVSTCSEEKETFCSFKKACADLDDDSVCIATPYDGELTLIKTLTIEAKELGYSYHPLKDEDYTELEPGYTIALKRVQKPVVIFVGASEEDERWTGFVDTDEDGKLVDVHHFLRPVVVVPMNISFSHNFTKAGIYKVKATMTSEPDDLKDEKEATVVVTTLLSGLSLSRPENCTDVGESVMLDAALENGLNVTLSWTTAEFGEQTYVFEEAPFTMIENYTCSKEGNFTVNLNATDGLNSEEAIAPICCINHVSRNWRLVTDSPQITPPGEIVITLYYTGNETYFPLGALADIDFGDDEIKTDFALESGTNMTETHIYTQGGAYNVTVQVYNSLETESFTTEVLLLDKLGILSVFAKYSEAEEDDGKDLHGPEKTDVPVNSVVSFSCNITGTVDNYAMNVEEKTIVQDSSQTYFIYKFENVGEYSASFMASNSLEQSNNATLQIRVMAATVGLGLQASPTNILPHEEVTFIIEFDSIDPFTCISFDADEGEVLETFGNEETCRLLLQDEQTHFNPRQAARKRRETEEVTWVDEKNINILYAYHVASVFQPIAKAFNTIFKVNATAEVEVTYPPSNIWIENNSTNIKRPMKYFREETFRLETTAVVYDSPTRSYVMKWHVDKITPSEDVIENIDISEIRSSNCSAIRFPPRYLDVGLYKIEYSIEIYENDTLQENPSCFTYLDIMSGNLRPMIIRGGASYILRGYDQMVYLEAEKYSEDPDDPEDKNFQMEWSCRYADPQDLLPEDEAYVKDISLSNQAVTDRHIEDITMYEECFKNPKTSEELQASQLIFNTGELHNFSTLYEIEVILSKDSRRQRTIIYLDVIEKNPPGLIIMCEKSVACRATQEGFIVNPSDWLAVRAECVTKCGSGNILYEWQIYGIDDSSQDRVTLDDWSSHVIIDEDRLGINRTLYKNYEEFRSFHIKVTGTDMDGDRPKGVAKLYIRTNIPPAPGTCTMSNTTGMATVSIFKLAFEGWTDPEGKDLRDFSVYNIIEGKKFHLHYGVKTYVEFILPPGESKILCAVKDEVGAITELSVATVVATLPDKETLEKWKSRVNVDFYMVEGRMSVMAQAIASEALVDETEREDNYLSVASEVDKIWKEYWELTGIDSSFYTKEAREEIEAELRDKRSEETEKEANKNYELLQSLEILPFEVIDDAEVYGQAVSALAESRPLNKGSKHLLTTFINKMVDSIVDTEVPHPQDKSISNMILGNVMNSLSQSISEEMIGGNFLESELEEAYEYLQYNITQPNFFILYVNGSRWEVEERVHMKKVEGAKNFSQGEVHDQTKLMRNITDRIKTSMAEDLMVGENPLVVGSRSGFELKVEKRHVDEISGETIENEGTSITLPSSCTLLGKSKGCREARSTESGDGSPGVGIVAVRWSSILETEGTEDVSLSSDSSTLDFSLTNREGNVTLKLEDTTEPFEVCLGISQPSDDSRGRLRHVQPTFGGKDEFLVYHQLTIEKSGATVKVEIVPDEKSMPLVFFYGTGYKPFLKVYDERIFLSDLQTDGGAYSMLFGLDTEAGEDFYFAVGHLSKSFSDQNGKDIKEMNLTRDDMTNKFSAGYSIGLYTTGCYYFSEEISAWSSEGCKVHSARSNMICCHCNHLTMFGSGFLVAPNKIDFSYVFANAGFEDNLIIYLTLIITLCLYVILAIWCRWKDKKDLTKLGATPLVDNDMQDKYFYEILVQTGYQFNAGTKSKVHFIISGEDDETDVRTITDDQRPIFQRGDLNCFIMSVPRCLGQLNYLRIWHDNTGEGKNASWYLKHVVVKDIITGYKYEFIAERWFAVEEGDGLIDYLIPVAGKEQATEFSHLFSNTSRRSLTDNHLWLSVFTRPPRSRFTRLQRLSCCIAILYLSMLTSAMWYETTSEQPSPGAFKFGPLSLSPEQIAVGMMSNLIVFPPSFLMIVLFRKARVRSLRPSHVNIALEKQYEKWRKEQGLLKKGNASNRTRQSIDEEALSKPKKKCLLPWWCAYISWFLVFVSVGCSVFFLWAYGLQFGNERTGKWLTSLIVSFFSSVFLTEPLKIFLLAIIMACLCGNPDVADDDFDDDEENPYLNEDEEWLHSVNSGTIVKRPKYRPIDPRSLETARKLREKEILMNSVLREIGVYVLYLWILFILSYGNRDPNSFYLRETTINNFIKPGDLWHDFHYVNNEIRFWNWTRNALIPELFAGLWYNGRIPLGLRLLVDDRNNFKIGYPVLRQVRARTDSCTVPDVMEDIIPECAGFGNLINENGRIYSEYWGTNLTMASRIPPEYKYMTASDLNGFPFWGQLDWYGGGGYVVPLIAKRYQDGEKLIRKMEHLEKNGWVDKDTRAVFVEFGTYNAQVNLFVVATIVAEFLPGGGIVPYYHIDPIRLLHYHTGSGLLQLVCQIGFIIFTVYYTFKFFKALSKEGRKYFSQYWNVADLANILASYAVIGVEIYKMIITWRVLAIFTATEGTGYIKLQEALLLDESFCYLIGFLMSLATLKFLKLLRFNKRIGSMLLTVRICAQELKGYAVCLLIVFFAFVALFWLILGRAVREFCSFVSSFESSISMLLQKFDYHGIENASPLLGPLVFFTFALTASVILINILLTIIIQSFEAVKQDVQFQNGDYELMDYMISRLKLFFRRRRDRPKVAPVTYAPKVNKKYDVMDSFNGKVDRLLDFINSVYLDEQVDMEFLNKARDQLQMQAPNPELEQKKSRPRKIPRYQSLHMKKHLDF